MIDPTPTCERVRRLLQLGEPGVERHLAECASCSLEAARLAPLLEALRDSPAVEVPPWLDGLVRSHLAGTASIARHQPRTWVGVWLSTAGGAALMGALLIALLNMYPAPLALARGLLLGLAYMTISSVATLPLYRRMAQSRETR